MNKRLSVTTLLALVILPTDAQERVYSTVDAQGRIHIIKSDVPEPKVDQVPKQPDVKAPVFQAPPSKHELDGEEYMDAEVLEQNKANQKPKTRFYYVPTGALGEKVVESEAGIAVAPTSMLIEPVKPMLKFSPDYQVLDKDWLLSKQTDLQQYCQHHQKLKPARLVKKSNALWIDAAEFISNQPDKILLLEQTLLTSTTIRLSSFANSYKTPKFYLPMMIFLNEQGCVLEGAWQYWSQAKAANDNQYSAVEGLLALPVGSKYIVLYPPDKTLKATLPLQNYGALLLEQ